MQTVVALAAALEAKDTYTADHADTMARMAVAVGRELSLSEPELRRVEYAALLHDVGKIAVSPEILDKPGPLSPEEREVLTRHTLIGAQIIGRIDYCARWPRSCAPHTSAGTATAIQTGWPVMRFLWSPASRSPATRSTR